MRINMILSGCLLAVTLACSNSPKVIAPVNSKPTSQAEVAGNESFMPASQPMTSEFVEHRIKVLEVLKTKRYTYILSEEGDIEPYWIAIPKRPVQVGEELIYRGGLVKKNFFSAEYNRVFETLYLVSEILPLNGMMNNQVNVNDPELTAPPKSVQPIQGAIKLKDLITNADNYAGKAVRISGKCVKINPMIMGRNWVHIQDESGAEFDLTVTTNEQVQLGQMINMEGILAVNKDFGAGYFYKVIVENAISLK
jgi:hypothetical protein